MPNPLQNHAQAEVDRFAPLESAAHTELAAAQAELRDRQTRHAAAVTELAERELEVAAVRRELGGSEVAANATAGGEQLRVALIVLRAARAAVFGAGQAMLAATDRLTRAKMDLDARRAALQRAQAALRAAQTRAEQLDVWRAGLALGSPLETLPALAAATLAGSAFTDAQAKIEAGLPEPLRVRALERLRAVIEDDRAAADQLVALEDTLAGLEAMTGGRVGELRPRERALERAEAALAEYVNAGQRWLSEAQIRLARIPTRRSLTAAELADLVSEPALIGSALAAEELYDQALAERAEARRARARRVAAIYADLAIADPEDAVETDPQIASFDAAIATADAAISTYEQSDHPTILRRREADVPEFIWQDLLDFAIAEDLLNRLVAITPADLIDAVDIAEAELAEALARARDVERRVEAIRAELELTQTSLARRRETADERRRAALQSLR